MLGPLTIRRDGRAVALPASRKVRALIAYLEPRAARGDEEPAVRAAVGRPQRSAGRAALVSEQDPRHRRRARPPARPDPRGHRAARPGPLLRRRAEVARAAQAGIETLPPDRLRALSTLFNGDFLEGLEIDRSLAFNGWLTAQRRRFRGCHALCWSTSSSARRERRGLRAPGSVAPAGALRPSRPRGPARCARPRRPHPGRRGAPGRHRPAVRGRGARLRADSRGLAVSQGARGRSAVAPPPPCSRRRPRSVGGPDSFAARPPAERRSR